MTAKNTPVKTEAPVPSASQRFTSKVINMIGDVVGGELQVSDFQKKLAQSYFTKIDIILKENEQKRASTPSKKGDPEFSWGNVNMEKLAHDVVAFTSVGLDPLQDNHVNLIPYKNNKTGKYDFTFIKGYKGMGLIAQKYGLDFPDKIVVELVYSNDHFLAKKMDMNNPVESYEFDVKNPFDRGEVIGGFHYFIFNDNPSKNKLTVLSLKDILKRKPEYASAEFWGGEKDEWKDGKKVGKIEVEGWFEEMAFKTIYRHAYNSITIDSQKIDEAHRMSIVASQSSSVENQVAQEIESNANQNPVSFNVEDVEEIEVVETFSAPEKNTNVDENGQHTIV